MGLFGFGTSESENTTNVHSENVAAQSGIALGNASQGNEINILTADPDVARTAISGNVAALNSAFDFGNNAVSANTALSKSAIDTVSSNAALSILGANDLATKFAAATSTERDAPYPDPEYR